MERGCAVITVRQQHPVFGVNYGPGWIGFISRRDNFISDGINWFSRWDEISHVPISHTLNILGADMTNEALDKGIVHGSLFTYLHDPDIALLVRKPRAMTAGLASRICANAESHLGEPYNFELIAALAAGETYTGRALNWLSRGWWQEFLVRRADKPDEWICSKSVATSLHQPELIYPFSVLTRRPALVKPIDLFEDVKIFEPGAIELVPDDQPLEAR